MCAHGYSSADSFDVARATVRCFVEDYRDRTLQADESGEADAERLESDACEAIAAAIRVVVSTRGLTVDEVAALGGLHLARPRPRPIRRVAGDMPPGAAPPASGPVEMLEEIELLED